MSICLTCFPETKLPLCDLMNRLFILLFCFLFIVSTTQVVSAKISPASFGLNIPVDSMQIKKQAAHSLDSIYSFSLKSVPYVYQIEKQRKPTNDRTWDFYLILILCLLLGLIRFTDPHYFAILIRSFRNPSGSRHFKEQIQNATVPNFLMNVFFAVITGSFIYYAGRTLNGPISQTFQQPLTLVWLIGGILAIYLGKYFVIRFSGWAFRVQTITELYLFNIFLINKIIGIVLLPFLIFIAFGGASMAEPMLLVALVVVAILIFNRYARSWEVFASFFQYSRFHFFTYLCASEIMPMAILLKLLLRTMA